MYSRLHLDPLRILDFSAFYHEFEDVVNIVIMPLELFKTLTPL